MPKKSSQILIKEEKMIRIPENARIIIKTLEAAGHSASIVGGCVRDALLCRIADDYDITTSALPEEIKACFAHTVDTGLKHGTVTVIIDSEPYEVTTYRIDGEYRDSRHPESVSFTDDIRLDLSRRDFTVNAMAYNERDGLIDFFGGRADLDAKVIRAVGDPTKRFSEDALRVLRAIRFAAVLGFDIESETASALRSFAPSLSAVSSERILVEWRKLLGGAASYEIISEYRDIIEIIIPRLSGFKMPSRERFLALPADERQLLLFATSSGKEGFAAAVKSLKMDNKTRDKGLSVLNSLIYRDSIDECFLRDYMIGRSDADVLAAARVSEALGICPAGVESRFSALMSEGAVRSISMLSVGGTELAALGYRGRAIGDELQVLLRAAALGECDNTKEALLSLAKSHL